MAKKKVKNNRKTTIDRHHILCRSRAGTDDEENIARIDYKLHQKYHSLFGNLTPAEILAWVKSYFWNGKYDDL